MLTPVKKKAARASDYYTKTPLRIEMGRRLAHGRRIAGMKQEEVALALGYEADTKGVHISEFESGARPAPPEKLVAMCRLYGITTDYVYGLTDDPEIGTTEGRVRLTFARMVADLPGVLEQVAFRAVDAVREDTSPMALADSQHRTVLELLAALQTMRAKVPEFDEAWPASKLVTKMAAAEEATKQYGAARERGRKVLSTRVRHQLDRVALPKRRAPAVPQQLPLVPATKKVKAEAAA